jgi:AcrR family transcriptional regulator
VRRTQHERRTDTLEKLHLATIEVIVNKGFSRMTTADIAAAADLSQGALFRYYASKTAAVVGATQPLFAKVMGDFERMFAAGSVPTPERVVQDLWDWFHTQDFTAISRLYAESSADAELRDAIQPIVTEHRNNTDRLLEKIFPGEDGATTRSVALATIYLMQGIAVEKHLIENDTNERKIIALLKKFASVLIPEAKKWNK